VKNAKIRDAVNAAITYLGEHPEEARYTDSVASAVLESGLAVPVTGPDGVHPRSGLAVYLAAVMLSQKP
jgi:hypothetical protein